MFEVVAQTRSGFILYYCVDGQFHPDGCAQVRRFEDEYMARITAKGLRHLRRLPSWTIRARRPETEGRPE